MAIGVLARRKGDPRVAAPLLRDLKRGTRQELLGATCVAVGLAGLEDAAPALREILTETGNPQVAAQAAVSLGLFVLYLLILIVVGLAFTFLLELFMMKRIGRKSDDDDAGADGRENVINLLGCCTQGTGIQCTRT